MNDALAVMGERYSLPLLRELMYGTRRFSDLAVLTGAPRSVLTTRLRTLESAGVLERRRYSEHPPRYAYHLTPAGADLLPVVLALKEWGEKHATDGPPPAVFEHSCGAELHPVTVCSGCREEITANSFRTSGGTHPPLLTTGG